MEAELVASIRENVRSNVETARNNKRTLELNRRRLLNETRPNVGVQEIANKLKNNSTVTPEQLSVLKNGLMTEENINDFMNVSGALKGLKREFTGLDTRKQMLAAECLCNLALAGSDYSHSIAMSVGSYLVPCLCSLNNDLVVTCAWTIGNLAGSDKRVCSLLVEQGAVNALLTLLAETNIEEIHEATLYALVHFVYTYSEGLKLESFIALLDIVKTDRRHESSYHLLFLLSCNPMFHERINEEFIKSLMDDFVRDNRMDDDENNSYRLIYIIRTLANVCLNDVNSDCVLGIVRSSKKHLDKFETVLRAYCKDLHKTMLWLLGNIYKTYTQNPENITIFNAICDKIYVTDTM